MTQSRRRFLAGGGMSVVGAGLLARVDKVAAMQSAPTSLRQVLSEQGRRGKSEALLLKPDEDCASIPSGCARLPYCA